MSKRARVDWCYNVHYANGIKKVVRSFKPLTFQKIAEMSKVDIALCGKIKKVESLYKVSGLNKGNKPNPPRRKR